MRILQIINNLGSGGAEKLISDFVPLMKGKGYDVEVLLLQKNGSIYIEALEEYGIKVTCLSENSLYSLRHIFRIRKYIIKERFDIINVHIFPALYFVALASLLGIGDAKLIFTEHNTYNKRMGSSLFRIIDKFVYRQYDKVIAITSKVKEAIDSHLNAKSDFSVIINNGVDIDRYENAIPINLSTIYDNYNNGHKVICMVGRFSEAKDQSTLIKAVEKLPDYVHLLLIGEGSLREEKEELSKKLKLENRIHFLGIRKDVPEIIKACDVGVLSSNWEGMPISALEVLASGTPFLGSRVPGIEDLFNDIDNSSLMLFENKNINDLSDKLLGILNDGEIARHNISIGQSVAANFSLDKMVNSYLKEYEILISS